MATILYDDGRERKIVCTCGSEDVQPVDDDYRDVYDDDTGKYRHLLVYEYQCQTCEKYFDIVW